MYRFKSLGLLFSLALYVAGGGISVAQQPVCQSLDSDPDGDGWGWENNATCVVEGSVADNSGTASLTTYCEYAASDMDGDGWGWENGASCQIGEASSTETPVTEQADYEPLFNASGKLLCQFESSDPDNDGYGWENNSSCVVPGAAADIAESASTRPTCTDINADPDNDGWGWENNATCIVVVDATDTNADNKEDTASEGGDDTTDSASQPGGEVTSNNGVESDEEEPAEAGTDTSNDNNADGHTATSEDVPAGDSTDTQNSDTGTEEPPANNANTADEETSDNNSGTTEEEPPNNNTEENVDSNTDTGNEQTADNDTVSNGTEASNSDNGSPDGESTNNNTESTEETPVADTEATEQETVDDETEPANESDASENNPSQQDTYLPEDITDLILVTGQSNTLGSNSTVDATLDHGHPRVFAYTSNGWERAELYQRWDNGAHPGSGSEEDFQYSHNNFALHFGKTLAALDPTAVVGFVLVSEPGEGIAHWAPGNTGMLRVQQKTLQAINELPHKSAIDGVLWHQGETDWQLEGTSDPDITQPAPVDYYPARLAALINNLRLEPWLSADKPFICGETINATGVNTHLMALNADDDPHTGCVEGAGLPSITESGNHFNAQALRSIGARYARQYLDLTR
ncbi:MAG: sialate O-acetylesterase [Pseudomonadota bacterium]